MATILGHQMPGDGIGLQTIEVRMTAHAAISRGDVLAVAPIADPITYKFTTTQNVDNDIVSVDDHQNGIFVVALEDVASGDVGRFAIQGLIDVKISGDPATGRTVTARVGNDLVVAAAGNKVLGYMLEDGVNGELKKVFFDGLNSFGLHT